MRVLAITRSSWDNSNNVGNTLTNLFGNIKNIELANLYFRSDVPKVSPCQRFFQIRESDLLGSIFHNKECGRIVELSKTNDEQDEKEKKLYSSVHSFPFWFPYFVREWLWLLGNWKTEQLKHYVSNFCPDVIFMPVFPCWYTSKILLFITSILPNSKVVLYHADDDYSLRRVNFSPLFWIYRFIQRKWVRRITSIADLVYCISEEQVIEYSKSLKCQCSLLQKEVELSDIPEPKVFCKEPVTLVYTGNLGCGRWKTLATIGENLREISKQGFPCRIQIFSSSKLSKQMERKLKLDDVVVFCGEVSSDSIRAIQKNADVLVHVESLSIIEASEVRLSFSTKIIDYLTCNRCILAVGHEGVASINYFVRNHCAQVVTNKSKLFESLKEIIVNENKRVVLATEAVNAAILQNKKSINESFEKAIEQLARGEGW